MSKEQSSGSPHWSKDFVEHLRTVHFELITVSVGLVLLVLSSRPYDPVAAIAQLEVLSGAANFWDVNRILAAQTVPELTGGRGYPRVVEVQATTNAKTVQISLNIVRFWWLLASDDKHPSELAVDNYKSKPSSENILGLRQWWSFHSDNHKFNILTKINSEGAATFTEPDKGFAEVKNAASLLPAERTPQYTLHTIDVELTPSREQWLLTGTYHPALGEPTAAPHSVYLLTPRCTQSSFMRVILPMYLTVAELSRLASQN